MKHLQRFNSRNFQNLVANECDQLGTSSYLKYGQTLIHNKLARFPDEIETFIPKNDLFYILNHRLMIIHYTDSYLGKDTAGMTDFPFLAVRDEAFLAHEFAHLLDFLYRDIFGVFMSDHLLFRCIIDDVLSALPVKIRAYYKDRTEVFARMFEVGYSYETLSVEDVYTYYPMFSRVGVSAGCEPIHGFEFENEWGERYRKPWLNATLSTIRHLVAAAKSQARK